MPIQYAFSYPHRWDAPVPFLDLTRMAPLEFLEPAWNDFPCLELAYRALDADRSLPIVLNAANEVAVAAFLDGGLAFTAIPELIARVMDTHEPCPAATLGEIRRIDSWARERAKAGIGELQSG
jgi:1-deoxy-D-xylulose-5-phosphate reductoisomerase